MFNGKTPYELAIFNSYVPNYRRVALFEVSFLMDPGALALWLFDSSRRELPDGYEANVS